jgi:sulfur carrier protein ThiS
MTNSAPKATVIIDGTENVVYLKSHSQLIGVLQKFDLLPESVLVVRNGDLIPEDTEINNGDVLTVINIISGG